MPDDVATLEAGPVAVVVDHPNSCERVVLSDAARAERVSDAAGA